MDDEFFASVLKKWACSSQEVVDLKKRLGRVERERNEYERNVAVLKARCSKSPIGEKRPVPPGVEFEVLDLDDVENKLENARLEY